MVTIYLVYPWLPQLGGGEVPHGHTTVIPPNFPSPQCSLGRCPVFSRDPAPQITLWVPREAPTCSPCVPKTPPVWVLRCLVNNQSHCLLLLCTMICCCHQPCSLSSATFPVSSLDPTPHTRLPIQSLPLQLVGDVFIFMNFWFHHSSSVPVSEQSPCFCFSQRFVN